MHMPQNTHIYILHLVIWHLSTDEVCKRVHLCIPVNARANDLAWHGAWNDDDLRAF